MQLKFKLTKESKVEIGVTFHRIQASKDFKNVKKGELGGWIEKDENLDQSGDAWVSGDAQVSGDARIVKPPLLIQGTKHTLTVIGENIKIGCENHSLKEWEANYKIIGKANGYTEVEISEYYEYILFAGKQIRNSLHKEKQ